MLDGLGISVKLKVPKEIKAAAKDLPEFSAVADRMRATLDASNITAQTVAVLMVVGMMIAALLIREQR